MIILNFPPHHISLQDSPNSGSRGGVRSRSTFAVSERIDDVIMPGNWRHHSGGKFERAFGFMGFELDRWLRTGRCDAEENQSVSGTALPRSLSRCHTWHTRWHAPCHWGGEGRGWRGGGDTGRTGVAVPKKYSILFDLSVFSNFWITCACMYNIHICTYIQCIYLFSNEKTPGAWMYLNLMNYLLDTVQYLLHFTTKSELATRDRTRNYFFKPSSICLRVFLGQ